MESKASLDNGFPFNERPKYCSPTVRIIHKFYDEVLTLYYFQVCRGYGWEYFKFDNGSFERCDDGHAHTSFDGAVAMARKFQEWYAREHGEIHIITNI